MALPDVILPPVSLSPLFRRAAAARLPLTKQMVTVRYDSDRGLYVAILVESVDVWARKLKLPEPVTTPRLDGGSRRATFGLVADPASAKQPDYTSDAYNSTPTELWNIFDIPGSVIL